MLMAWTSRRSFIVSRLGWPFVEAFAEDDGLWDFLHACLCEHTSSICVLAPSAYEWSHVQRTNTHNTGQRELG